MGIDDALKAMEEDYEGATKLPPIEYARLRGLYPQRVYKAIRDRKLTWQYCDCGRKVVVIDEADEVFKLGAYAQQPSGLVHVETDTEEEAASGSDLDA